MRVFFCPHTQEREGLIVPGTERHTHLLEVRTRMYVRLRQLWVFITRENASLATLAHLITFLFNFTTCGIMWDSQKTS